MEEQTVEVVAHEPRRPSRARVGIIAGLIAGAIATLMTIASAVGGANAQDAPALPDGGDAKPMARLGMKHGGMHGFGMGIHGEFTARKPGGGYQTIASQVGEVTAVSHDSITLKSEDGYTRTYVVDDNTLVNAGNDGIDDVKKGDNVRVAAIVSGGSAHAVEIMDGTNISHLRERWAPRPVKPSASASPSATG
jgi:hypothetical protein